MVLNCVQLINLKVIIVIEICPPDLFFRQAVSTRSVFCLKIHEGLTHDMDFVLEQWKKDIGPGTHVILGN